MSMRHSKELRKRKVDSAFAGRIIWFTSPGARTGKSEPNALEALTCRGMARLSSGEPTMPFTPLPIAELDADAFATAFADFLHGDYAFVVALRLDEFDIVAAKAIVPGDEEADSRRFHHADDRRRFILGRAAQRCLLSRATGRKAEDLAFQRSAFGKLFLPAAPHFNLSHSGNLILIGLHRYVEIGVDVEAIKPVADWPAMARLTMTQVERDLIASTASGPDETALQRAFLGCWTRKEAVIKALGLGFSAPLQTFSVVPGGSGWMVTATSGPFHDKTYCCFDLALGETHAGAVAVAAPTVTCVNVATSFDALRRLATRKLVIR